jgi:hypothetical protein
MHDDPKPNRPLERLQFPGEDSVYRSARNALLDEEMALRRQIERVSARRRALPPGGIVREDYVFEGLDRNRRPTQMKLSELFAPGKEPCDLQLHVWTGARPAVFGMHAYARQLGRRCSPRAAANQSVHRCQVAACTPSRFCA